MKGIRIELLVEAIYHGYRRDRLQTDDTTFVEQEEGIWYLDEGDVEAILDKLQEDTIKGFYGSTMARCVFEHILLAMKPEAFGLEDRCYGKSNVLRTEDSFEVKEEHG